MDDLIPPMGEPNTVIDRLREYTAPIDPDLFHRTGAAPEDMIALYAELAGFGASAETMPTSYQMFLRSMGLDDGGLFINFRMKARLPSLVKLYQDCLRSEPDSLNPELPVIATYIIGDQISFDRRVEVSEPEVVDSSDGEFVAPLSRSWESLLMQAAMLHIEARRVPYGFWLSSSPNNAARALPYDAVGKQSAALVIDSFAQRLGLAIAWPSDSRHRIAVGKDVSLFAKIDPTNAALVWTFSTDEAMLKRIAGECALTMGAKPPRKLQLVKGALLDVPS